jgi:hypothetical protein
MYQISDDLCYQPNLIIVEEFVWVRVVHILGTFSMKQIELRHYMRNDADWSLGPDTSRSNWGMLYLSRAFPERKDSTLNEAHI